MVIQQLLRNSHRVWKTLALGVMMREKICLQPLYL